MVNDVLTNPVIQVSGTAAIGSGVEVANLVSIEDSQVVTTSLKVAEAFGKNHRDVLKAIRELDCSPEFHGRNFALSFKISKLPNNGHRKDPMYYITRDGFVFLVMGFTGKTAAKLKEAYINAFNEMEERLRRQQQEEELRTKQMQPTRTMAEMPMVVRENLEQTAPIVESYGNQRVVSSVTLARLTGRKHENICDSVRRMFKHTLRPNRLFIRQTRTVHRGNGAGYDRNDGVLYYITIDGFRTMATHAVALGDDVAKLIMAEFYKAKGKNRPGQPNGTTRKPNPKEMQPQQEATTNLPQTPADMMQRFVTAMAVMMGVDVKQVSNLMNGGNK